MMALLTNRQEIVAMIFVNMADVATLVRGLLRCDVMGVIDGLLTDRAASEVDIFVIFAGLLFGDACSHS